MTFRTRLLIGTASLFALIAVLLLVLLATTWPAAWIRHEIITRTLDRTGGDLAVDAAEFRFFPPRLTLRGIRFRRHDPTSGDLRMACQEIRLSLPYRIYRGRFDQIGSVSARRPEVDWTRPRGTSGGAGSGAPRQASAEPLRIGRLAVYDASLRILDAKGDWELRLEGAALQGAGEGSGAAMRGLLEEGRFSVRQGRTEVAGLLTARFQASGRRIAIPSFALNRESDPFHATGSLEADFTGVPSTLHLVTDLKLAPPERPREVLGDLSGAAHLEARGDAGPEGVRLEGTIRSPQLRYHGLGATHLEARADYRPGELRMFGIRAQTLGGDLAGQARMGWQVGSAPEPLLEADVSLRAASAQEIFRFLQWTGVPLTGRVDHRGQFRIRGFDPATLEGKGTASLAGTLSLTGPRPVTGTGEFRIRGLKMEVAGARLRSPSGSARFAGVVRLGPRTSLRGTLEADTEDLGDLRPFLARLPESIRGPLAEIVAASPEGRIAFGGTVGMDSGALLLDGRADARRLQLRGKRLGDLEAEFRLTPSRIEFSRLVLSGGETTADLSGWVRPRAAAEARADTLSLRGQVVNLELEWLRDWTGLTAPVAGGLRAVFDLSGRPERLMGRVDWSVERPAVALIPLERVSGRFLLLGEGMAVEEVLLARESATAAVSGTVGFGGRPLLLYVEAQAVPLEWLHQAGWIPVLIGGAVSGRAQITGSLEEPSLEADVEAPACTVKGIGIGAISAHLTMDREGGAIQLLPEEKGVTLSGRVEWEQDLPFQAEVDLDDFELAASSLGGDLGAADAGLVLSGGIRVTGVLRDASRLDISGNLVKAVLRLGQEELVSQTPAYFRWRPPHLEVTPVQLEGPGTKVALSGRFDPAGGTYTFKAEGNVALSLLAPLRPDATLGGTGAFSLTVSGTPERAATEGWASVQNGRIQGIGLPIPLTSLRGRLVLEPPGRFRLEGVEFLAGGGHATLEGGGSLVGLRPSSLDLGIEGKDVQIAFPDGFRGRYDLALQLVRGETGGRLAGRVDLVRGVYGKDFKIESRLLSLGREDPLLLEEAAPGEAGFLDDVELDLDLKAGRGLWIVNDFATLEGRADLHVGGTLGEPQVTGRITAFEGGTVRFRRVEYRVVRGNIDLIDRDRFNPYFDLAAETRVSNYDVTLKLDGSLEHFTYELTSSPPLAQPDIVALLVSGRTLDSLASPAGTGFLAEEMAAGYLTGSLTQGLGGRIQGVTGLDQFSIDPVILTREGDPASRVTVGKEISENLVAAYSTVLGSSSEEVYQLEYRVSRDFKFTSIRDADGSLGGDLRYVWRLTTGPEVRPTARVVEKKIEQVTLEGDAGVSHRKLLRLFRLREGDVMDRVQAAAGVDRVLGHYRKKGYLQARVDTEEQPVEGRSDRVNLILRVASGPAVQIRVKGTESDKEYGRKMREVWVNSFFPDEAAEEVRGRLEKLLRQEGYYRAKVSAAVPMDTPRRREVVLSAQPGQRVRVERVEIAGNNSIETPELLGLLESEKGLRNFLNPEEVAADAGRIRAHYLSQGYPEAKVPLPKIELSEDGTRATLRFDVEEGPPVRIAAVRVEGNHFLPAGKLLEGFPIQERDPFSRARARNGAEAIRLAYDRAGFQEAKVSYELGTASGSELVFRVEEGPRQMVGKIVVEGNRITRKEVIERELTFKEGDPLSRDEILKSQRALYRLGAFLSVDIRQAEGEDPERPTVRIQVAESQNLIQSVGVGYDSEEGVRGLYEVTNLNLFGRARTVGLQLRGSGVDSRAQVLLKDPYLFNRRLDSLLSGYWEKQERESFTARTVGSSLQVSNRHGEYDRTIYRYTFKDIDLSDVDLSDPDVLEEARLQSLRLSGLSAAFVHDSRDDFFNPRGGSFASADLGAYGRRIGSEAQFLKFFAVGSLFHKLFSDSVWAQSIRLGLANPFGATDSVPLSERFFAGGDTTVRGFNRDEVGPKDPLTGKPTGGEALLVFNEEFRYPIWRVLRGIVFFDAGNLATRASALDLSDFRTVLGLGFRIDTPIGPFRFEYGWKLDRREDETAGEFHLSIGQAF